MAADANASVKELAGTLNQFMQISAQMRIEDHAANLTRGAIKMTDRCLQERAEPGEGERLAVALRVHVICPSHVRGCALLAAPPPAVLSPRRLDGRRV